jgi:hypothetical protein
VGPDGVSSKVAVEYRYLRFSKMMRDVLDAAELETDDTIELPVEMPAYAVEALFSWIEANVRDKNAEIDFADEEDSKNVSEMENREDGKSMSTRELKQAYGSEYGYIGRHFKNTLDSDREFFFAYKSHLVEKPIQILIAADYLNIPILVEVVSHYIADVHIKNKKRDEIRAEFGIEEQDVPDKEIEDKLEDVTVSKARKVEA